MLIVSPNQLGRRCLTPSVSFFCVISMKNIFYVSLLCLVCVGCGSGIKFGGTVKFDDGSPLQGGTVRFSGEKNQYDGEVRQDGTYTLVGATPKDGIPVGKYKVSVSGVRDDDGVSPVPEKYSSIDTSGLTCEVMSGGKFDITLEKAAPAKEN